MALEKQSRAYTLYMAELAGVAERYTDMKNYMHKYVMMAFSDMKDEDFVIVDLSEEGGGAGGESFPTSSCSTVVAAAATELTDEESELLCVAYKKSIAPLRHALQSLDNLKRKGRLNMEFEKAENEFKGNIKGQISDLCNEMMGLLETYLIPWANRSESKVLWLQMKMEFHGYLAEIGEGDERNKEIEKATQSYQQAQTIAESNLRSSDPGRLSLEINFSSFTYDILNDKKKAFDLSNEAYSEAMEDLRALEEESSTNYKLEKTRTLINTLLGNIICWKQNSFWELNNITYEPNLGETGLFEDIYD